MRAPMIRKLLPLAVVLAIVATACSEPPSPELEFGSGKRFVPLVADPLNDAGVDPSVVVTDGGLPVVAYFAFEEVPEEGQLPATRPVGAPSLPGVLMTTVSEEGIWTRGAIAIEAQIPNVSIPFSPAEEPSVGKLTARNVTGLQVVADGDVFHTAWGSSDGLYYATGSLDPSATEQVTVSQVTSTPPRGLSIGVDGGGTPWIAFYTSTSSAATVNVATRDGERWRVDSIAEPGGCEGCRTAVVPNAGGVAIAYSSAGNGVAVATNDGENGWTSFDVEGSGGGQGLAATATSDGLTIAYYDGAQVVVATGSAQGPFATVPGAEVGDADADAEGARTSVAVTDDGTTFLAWQDAVGVHFAEGDGSSFTPIETAPDTEAGEMPAVSVTPDGARAYLAWRDSEAQDLLVGLYGDVSGLALAEPSPTPSGAPEPPTPPSGGDCAAVADGTVAVQASGVAFDTSCIDVPAGEPFTIAFDNQDAGVQHNIAIFPSDQDLTNPLFKGDLITGPDSIDYEVDALDAGEYYFHCDIHPTMNGTVNAGSGGAGATGATAGGGTTGASGSTAATGSSGSTGSTGSTGGGVTVVAQNVTFDTDRIELAAGAESTITFDNQDAGVQHNVSIYADDTAAENLFRGDLITGPDQIAYVVPALDAGEYYFRCDVHPTMSGTVSVA